MNTWLGPATASFLEETATVRKAFRDKHTYYHREDLSFFAKMTQSDSVVLLIGANVIELALQLRCRKLYVYELDPAQEIPALPESITAVSGLGEAFAGEPIDYVLIPYGLQLIDDIQGFLETLRLGVLPQTRLITVQYNFLWAPLMHIAQVLRLKSPMPDLSWLNPQDLRNLFMLTNFEEVTDGTRCLIPFYIPWFTGFCNQYIAPLPGIRLLCQKTYATARARTTDKEQNRAISVTVVVPARNEAGNIGPLLDRMPVLHPQAMTQLIFVEGHSRDNTWDEIKKQLAIHPRRHLFELASYQQTGTGKADAVRLGFSHATGELLMILDADLSVQPEDLPRFYNAFQKGSAEFLNGSRLVYKMDRQAMQVLNLFFNKVFALLLSWLIGQPVKDTLCGTKVLTRRDYNRVRTHLHALAELDPFGDFELLLGASCLNLKIRDVPVRYKERVYGTTNIRRFKNGWELLRMVLRSWTVMK